MAAQGNVQCTGCAHFAPALDPVVQKAFLGYCKKRQWPFHEMVPQGGMAWMKEHECPLFEPAQEDAD